MIASIVYQCDLWREKDPVENSLEQTKRLVCGFLIELKISKH